MAESNDGQEKTEDPTSKRLQEAREKGQVPRSREFNTLAILLISAVGLWWLGEKFVTDLIAFSRDQFTLSREEIFDPNYMMILFKNFAGTILRTIAPLLLALAVAAIVSGIALSGFNLSLESLSLKLDRLDPLQGLGRIFAWRGVLELVKSFAKFAIVGAIALLWLSHHIESIAIMGREPIGVALSHAGDFLISTFLLLSITLILIVAIDIPFQLWDNKRQLKMTKQEVKDEMKETEGRPEVKSRVRKLQVEIARRRMMADVPTADVVITNPTHFSVALRYDEDKMRAPRVIAKGADVIAFQIRSIAQAHKVPILAMPPLARALYVSTDINQEIPSTLYMAVAQILAYIYQLKVAEKNRAKPPNMPQNLPIPSEELLKAVGKRNRKRR